MREINHLDAGCALRRRYAGCHGSEAPAPCRATNYAACGCRRGDRMSAPAASWCDPAGESPAQVRSSIRLVASVAWPLATVVAKRTQQLHGVWDRATKGQISQGPRVSIRSKATCAAPLCEVLTPCRGQRPHHVQKDRIGSWEVSCLAVSVA